MGPPMNDSIILRVVEKDQEGNVLEDRQGRPARRPIQTKARVKETSERFFAANGEETQATLRLTLPPELDVQDGDVVEWVNPFGRVITGTVAGVTSVNDYSGLVVYYRKAWTV